MSDSFFTELNRRLADIDTTACKVTANANGAAIVHAATVDPSGHTATVKVPAVGLTLGSGWTWGTLTRGDQTLSVTGTSGQFTDAMAAATRYILRADAIDIWYAVAADPTATVDTNASTYLPRGQTAILAGELKVACIRAGSTSGTAVLIPIEE